MTAAVLRRHIPAPQWNSALAGTLGLLRLSLRCDRVALPLWVLLLSVPLPTVYIGSVAKVYPTVADRAAAAAAIMASPAQRAVYGPVYNHSLAAIGLWKASMFHVLIAVAVILTVIRHTRADEETGRTELIGSTAVGRCANLSAALLLSFGASVVTGVVAAAGLLTTDIPACGSLAFGAALCGSGLVFTAVAGVAAQLSPSARVARGIAFATLGTAFALRAVGDAGGPGTLSWLSPLGWSLQVRPYAGDRWWVLLLHLVTTVLLTGAAYRLLTGRDVGAGLIPEHPGRDTAAVWLGGIVGLAWRLDRGAILVWTVGLALYGLLVGSLTHGIGDQLGSSSARDMVARLGGSDASEQAFVAVGFSILGMIAAAFAVSLALRPHGEETGRRAETLLAGSVSRTRFLAGHLVLALAGSASAILLAGLAAGLAYGMAADDITGKLPAVLSAAAVQVPAMWLPAALTVALFGFAPRFTPAVWAVFVGFVALYLLGSLAGFPRWLLDMEPFAHTPRLGGGNFTIAPLLWLLIIDAVLITLGINAFRRRDMRL